MGNAEYDLGKDLANKLMEGESPLVTLDGNY